MSSTTSFTKAPVNEDAPMSVHSVRVLGTSITRKSFLDTLTQGLFTPQTTSDVFKEAQDIATKLDHHDVFDEIKVYLDTNQNLKDTVDVTIQLKEKSRGLVKTAFCTGDNEVHVIGSVLSRNLFGGAETFDTSFSFGNRTLAAGEAVLSTPLNGSPYLTLSGFVNGAIKDHSLINPYKEESQTKGLRVKIQSLYGENEISYALTQRDITAYPTASSTIREQSGANTKSSVYHSFVHDTRNHKTLPTEGHYLGLFQEWAGVGSKGDSNFIKHEIFGQTHRTLVNKGVGTDAVRVSLSLSGKAGLLASLDNNKVNLSDRLYLGGPLSLRGFKSGGIGARNGNDALGGNVYWAVGASMISTIPGSAHLPIKLHAFANAGNMSQWQRGEEMNKTIEDLSREPRVSIGLGLIFHHEVARIETNFTIPLRFRTGDVIDSGFGFGVGINFL
ncbi:surface antigen-domain-containing protein [Halteromyces radiatus]|uniref:surface antigen-domain-containing protein n=1 Tax=Halteromyces radiatus TaxID=101107 RepID=UPI00221F0624|nr:surface antigen-domain-containing protein [Halteromyces radiatus]KAI8098910.1 surface antigen-domain-containing protein [Halteromyces radiatus]